MGKRQQATGSGQPAATSVEVYWRQTAKDRFETHLTGGLTLFVEKLSEKSWRGSAELKTLIYGGGRRGGKSKPTHRQVSNCFNTRREAADWIFGEASQLQPVHTFGKPEVA